MKTGVVDGRWARRESAPAHLAEIIQEARRNNLAIIKSAQASLSEIDLLRAGIAANKAAMERHWAALEKDLKDFVKRELGINPKQHNGKKRR